jgi:hypothetical protein
LAEASEISFSGLYIAAIYVEDFNQNPYWYFDKILFSIRYWYNLEYGTSPIIFKKEGNVDIDL